jgi:hypothetical protein
MAAGRLAAMPWNLHEVRRGLRPRAGDPSKPGNAVRSLRIAASGSCGRMTAELAAVTARRGVRLTAGDKVASIGLWPESRGGRGRGR